MIPINYECHITITPLSDDRRKDLQPYLDHTGFRFAKLLFSKDETSTIDTFMSAKDTDFNNLFHRMHTLLHLLRPHVQIFRYKIEATLIDSKHLDILSLKA